MRTFSAKETEWLQELDGIELANFWPRAAAFLLDWFFISILFMVLAVVGAGVFFGVQHLRGKPLPNLVQLGADKALDNSKTLAEKDLPGGSKLKVNRLEEEGEVAHIVNKVIIPVLYFGIFLWKGKGRTPGKRLMNIRVVSLMHRHITFWHAVERALGYGAAALELGFGFVQFFIHPYRRCAQDRLAETIVVTERSYQAFQHRLSHPLIPDITE